MTEPLSHCIKIHYNNVCQFHQSIGLQWAYSASSECSISLQCNKRIRFHGAIPHLVACLLYVGHPAITIDIVNIIRYHPHHHHHHYHRNIHFRNLRIKPTASWQSVSVQKINNNNNNKNLCHNINTHMQPNKQKEWIQVSGIRLLGTWNRIVLLYVLFYVVVVFFSFFFHLHLLP